MAFLTSLYTGRISSWISFKLIFFQSDLTNLAAGNHATFCGVVLDFPHEVFVAGMPRMAGVDGYPGETLGDSYTILRIPDTYDNFRHARQS